MKKESVYVFVDTYRPQLTFMPWSHAREKLNTNYECDNFCQWIATGQWISPGTPVSSTNKTDRHDITAIILKVALNTINLNQIKFWKITFHFKNTGNIKTGHTSLLIDIINYLLSRISDLNLCSVLTRNILFYKFNIIKKTGKNRLKKTLNPSI